MIYLSTNPYKITEAKTIFNDKYGLDIEAVNPDFEIYEIQAKTCGEVVAFSVQYAADRLGQPCLKSDTGLYVEALGGLPGPYNAYFDKQIGVEKFLAMLVNESNRKARIEHCFAYCEPGKEPVVFSGGSTGTIAKNRVVGMVVGMIFSIFRMEKLKLWLRLAMKTQRKRFSTMAML